jgi:hypothetical protein
MMALLLTKITIGVQNRLSFVLRFGAPFYLQPILSVQVNYLHEVHASRAKP